MMRVSKLIEAVYDARAVLQQVSNYQFPDGRGGVRTLPILSLDDCVTNTAQDVVRAFTTGFSEQEQAAALQCVEEDIARITDRVYTLEEICRRMQARADQEAPAVLALIEVLASPYQVNVQRVREQAMLAKEALELYRNTGSPLSEEQQYATRRVLRSLDESLKNARPSLRESLFGEQPYVGILSVAAVISHVKKGPPKRAESVEERANCINREQLVRGFRKYLPMNLSQRELATAVSRVVDAVARSPCYDVLVPSLDQIIDGIGKPVQFFSFSYPSTPAQPAFFANGLIRFIQTYDSERPFKQQLRAARKQYAQSFQAYGEYFS